MLVKFIYSEKATKVCEILHTVKSKGKISQNFVAFSEYMNFTENSSFELLRILSNCLRTKKYMHEGFSEQVGVCLPVGPLNSLLAKNWIFSYHSHLCDIT